MDKPIINQGNYKHLTKEFIEEKLKELNIRWPEVYDLGNGLFKIDTGKMSVYTNKAGVEQFQKTVMEQLKSKENG